MRPCSCPCPALAPFNLQIESPFSEAGLYRDWEAIEALCAHAFTDRLRANVNEYALLLAEPSHNSREAREKTVELMFEKFGVPALFLARNAVLSSFATARQTSLVLDAGYATTTAAAVHDGYLLGKTVVHSPVAGRTMNQAMQAAIEGGVGKRAGVVPSGLWGLLHKIRAANFHEQQSWGFILPWRVALASCKPC